MGDTYKFKRLNLAQFEANNTVFWQDITSFDYNHIECNDRCIYFGNTFLQLVNFYDYVFILGNKQHITQTL